MPNDKPDDTAPEKKPKLQGRVTFHGFVPDTDPRYKSGWNYLSGKNLHPHLKEKSAEEAQEEAPPQEPVSKAELKEFGRRAKEQELFAGLAQVKQWPIAPDEPQQSTQPGGPRNYVPHLTDPDPPQEPISPLQSKLAARRARALMISKGLLPQPNQISPVDLARERIVRELLKAYPQMTRAEALERVILSGG